MESPLEVLSRAATMVQDNSNEARLTAKELPTTKWRRERRLRTTEYQHSISTSSSSSSSSPSSTTTPPTSPHCNSTPCNVAKPLNETTNTTASVVSIAAIAAAAAAAVASNNDCPIDMSVTSTTIKPRTPPPPYREPLPGSTFAALARPSVITQAPPKRDNYHHHNLISNRENNNRSTESISMCDPVIDEHFRRSLGADYMALFGKKSPTLSPSPSSHSQQSSPTSATPPTLQQKQQQSQQQQQQQPKPANSPINSRTTITVTNSESISSSVDDHFAKALGDTWKKLQQADKESKNENSIPTTSSLSKTSISSNSASTANSTPTVAASMASSSSLLSLRERTTTAISKKDDVEE